MAAAVMGQALPAVSGLHVVLTVHGGQHVGKQVSQRDIAQGCARFASQELHLSMVSIRIRNSLW